MAQPAGTEPKLGVIPRVVKYGFGGIREYSILLTDRRFIFVLASLNRMFLVAAAIGGQSARRSLDPRHETLRPRACRTFSTTIRRPSRLSRTASSSGTTESDGSSC